MITLSHLSHKLNCEIILPASKSISNRLLIINFLSGNKTHPSQLSEAADTRTMYDLLEKISRSDITEDPVILDVKNAGTVMRFLTALLSITPGNWLLTGSERMQQRPVKPLVDALLRLGATISYSNNEGYPPLLIQGNSNLNKHTVSISAGMSSQFISALMMIAPNLPQGLTIDLQGDIISSAYIAMTKALMERAGAGVEFEGNQVTVYIKKYALSESQNRIEPDWSAAAFWYQMVALSAEAEVVLRDLSDNSVQGDAVLPEIFSNLGVKSTFHGNGVTLTKSGKQIVHDFACDFTNCPDLAQAVVVTCAALKINASLTGLKTLRIKETDRIQALQNELLKVGCLISAGEDTIFIKSGDCNIGTPDNFIAIETYDDHRMAMAFAPLALLLDKITICDPGVVSKSYPGFWNDMKIAGFSVDELKP